MSLLQELHQHGQSFWYDNIRRQLLEDGTIKRLIDQDGLRGITSNPSIFEKAIGQSDDYDTQIGEMVKCTSDSNKVYEALALADIQAACDLFADLYEKSEYSDGFVSLEVSPLLASDTLETVKEARRLYLAVGRPNVMIKVPATAEGIPAIRQLISEGINVNVTLMFNMDHYEAVAEAYIEGIERLLQYGGDPKKVASVASFFVSRVDSAVDEALEAKGNSSLMGKIAIANAKVVYQRYKALFYGDRFAKALAVGARPQRLLWASTSTKNPDYPDTLYIDQLIGSETVNTMPPKTMNAFRDHGVIANQLEAAVEEAEAQLTELEKIGVDLKEITEQLQVDGVNSFSKSFSTLMEAVTQEMSRSVGKLI